MLANIALDGLGLSGSSLERLMAFNMDPGCLRPYRGADNRTYITLNDGKTHLINNVTATLRKDEWIQIDEAVIRAATERLGPFNDLRAAGLEFNISAGMGKTVLEYEKMSDITDAEISMDGLRESEGDRPHFDLGGLPLPLIHKDFKFSARQVMASRNNPGTAIDTSSADLASRRVIEMADKLTLGVGPSYAYSGYNIYGYTNFPSADTETLTDPSGTSWTPQDTLEDVLSMRQKCYDMFHYGPFVLYNSPAWDQYLDEDFSANKGDNSLRNRLSIIRGITDIRTADHLADFDMVLVQFTSDVARAVVGMDVVTVQWETHGGMQLNFKVMAIPIIQVRADINGNTGIVYGSV